MINKRIVQELSNEFKLPEHIIELIVKHPYKFQKDLMVNGKFEPFRHPHFGVFAVKPYRYEMIMKLAEINKKAKEENKNKEE